MRGPRARTAALDAALWYALTWGWSVAPGTRWEQGRCTCGVADCPTPGEHPADADWAEQATRDPEQLTRWLVDSPGASVVLPTGREFDVVEVESGPGLAALHRMVQRGDQPGPVVATSGGRLLFFVAPGDHAELPALIAGAGLADSVPVRGRGPGDYVVVPPSGHGERASARWAHIRRDRTLPLPRARLVTETVASVGAGAAGSVPGLRRPLAE